MIIWSCQKTNQVCIFSPSLKQFFSGGGKNKEVLLLQCRFWIIHRGERNNLDDQTQTQVWRNCNMRGRKGTQDRSLRPFVVKQNIRKESNKFFASSFFFFVLQNSKKWKNGGIFVRAWFPALWLSLSPSAWVFLLGLQSVWLFSVNISTL